MSFKKFLNNVEFKYPTSNGKKTKIISLEEYRKTIDHSTLSKKGKKDLKSRTESGKDIPIYCEDINKFFMLNPSNAKTKDVKSREDKILCGILHNGLLNESKEKDETLYKHLKENKLPWDAPQEIYHE